MVGLVIECLDVCLAEWVVIADMRRLKHWSTPGVARSCAKSGASLLMRAIGMHGGTWLNFRASHGVGEQLSEPWPSSIWVSREQSHS